MHFTQDQTAGVNLIRSHAPGELRINQTVAHRPLIVTARYLRVLDAALTVQELTAAHADLVKQQQPELVLIGSGERQEFPPPEFIAAFTSANIGVEVMSTAAACRTYNVLISEHRAAAALLIP